MAFDDLLSAVDRALGIDVAEPEVNPEEEEKRRKLGLIRRATLPAAQLESGELPGGGHDLLNRFKLPLPAASLGAEGTEIPTPGQFAPPREGRGLRLPAADLAKAPQETFDEAISRARGPALPPADLTPAAPPVRDGAEVASLPKAPAVPALRPRLSALQQLQAQGEPKLHGWKRILDIVGQILGPGIEERIPGSPGNYQLRLAQARKAAAGEAELGKASAQQEQDEAEARKARAEAGLKERELEQPQAPKHGAPKERTVTIDGKPVVQHWDEAAGQWASEPGILPYEKAGAEKNTKEQIQAQINAELAKPKPDRGVVKGLQDRLKAIDPLGSERVNISLSQANEKDERKRLEEKAIETAAQALAAGNLTRLRDVTSFRQDQRLLVFARALELNPNFNQAKIERQIKTLELYTTGKQGDQLQSFGTFLEHAGALAETMDALKGATPAKILNRPINWLRQNIGDDVQYQRVLAALDPVQKEFEAYLLNNRALYLEDRATVDKIINEDLSPNQLMGALEQMGHTVQARFNEANRRFKNTMGKNIEELVGPLTDEAVAGAKRIGVKVGIEAAPRVFGHAPAGKKEGDTGTLPDGTKVVVRKGKIVAQ